jgi:hypothetical protein
MLLLGELKPGQAVVGLEPAVVVTVAAIIPIADGTVEVIDKTPDGAPDYIKRAVSENASALGLKRREWE